MVAALASRRRPPAGFSLLELLVVVTIIAILAGAFVLSVGALGPDRELQREAERLQTLFMLLNEEAVMESRDYGILFSASGYRFYIYDYTTLTWLVPGQDRLLSDHVLPPPLQLNIELEDREVRLARDFLTLSPTEQPEPHAIIFGSGETTPVVIDFFRDVAGGSFRLEVEFDGSTTLTEVEFGAG